MRTGPHKIFAVLALCAGLSVPAHAIEPGEALHDPALESRAREISSHLRCLVCQNQSIDDSQAPLAKDLRLLVRERLSAGDADADVLEFVRARYGDFVLLKPPLRPGTLLLWSSPFLLLILGGAALWSAQRRRAAAEPPRPLTEAERETLASLVARQGDGPT